MAKVFGQRIRPYRKWEEKILSDSVKSVSLLLRFAVFWCDRRDGKIGVILNKYRNIVGLLFSVPPYLVFSFCCPTHHFKCYSSLILKSIVPREALNRNLIFTGMVLDPLKESKMVQACKTGSSMTSHLTLPCFRHWVCWGGGGFEV